MNRLLHTAMLWLALLPWCLHASAQPSTRFVSIALHDVVDTPGELDDDSMTSDRVVALFEWLSANGWTAISLDDVERARRGIRPLPPRAVLLTVDDGHLSLYTRVYPLALAYRMPIVAAVVGTWMDTPADGWIRYGDRRLPRSKFISWKQAREMEASGLVEFASHSHALHEIVVANPQGNQLPAAQNLRYSDGRYENTPAFRARISADLGHARERMEQELGHRPRAIAWPYGRYNQLALDAATDLGFQIALTLAPQPADALHPLDIGRFLPTENPELGILVANLRFQDPWLAVRRIVEVDPARIVGADAGTTNQHLGQTIERLLTLGATHVMLDAATLSGDGRVDSVWFPTPLLPVKGDVLSRLAAQMRARAGVDVVIRLPHAAVLKTFDDPSRALALYADLAAHVPLDALVVEDADALGVGTANAPAAPWEVRARRAAANPAQWSDRDSLALEAFRTVEQWRPGIELYWLAPPSQPMDRPSAVAEVTLVPRTLDSSRTLDVPELRAPLSQRVGLWWTSDSPPDAIALARAVRAFQARGGTIVGWRPDDPLADVPRAADVAATVSARSTSTQEPKP